tara:strand:- start:879 stop:1151 length:273 start_codon:yes stop_codon:yes gene_type:complete
MKLILIVDVLILIIMMPYLDDLEFTRADLICIILNLLGYLIFGYEQMIYIVITTFILVVLGVITIFIIECCCLPDSRQAVFAPYGREHYD